VERPPCHIGFWWKVVYLGGIESLFLSDTSSTHIILYNIMQDRNFGNILRKPTKQKWNNIRQYICLYAQWAHRPPIKNVVKGKRSKRSKSSLHACSKKKGKKNDGHCTLLNWYKLNQSLLMPQVVRILDLIDSNSIYILSGNNFLGPCLSFGFILLCVYYLT
jgi:hypothetical protein